MGAVTGKGLADLIRENFGVKVTALVLFLFVFSDLGNTAAEFAGIAFGALHPPWHEILLQTVVPHFVPTQAYVLTAIGVIGTTISPWMQFYIQSSVVEKGVRIKEYPYSRIDVITGAIITDVIAFFIIVTCGATIFVHNAHLAHGASPLSVNTAGDVATALVPLAGKYAALLFAIGLLNAAIFTASILPLSTAYYVCEAFGFESGGSWDGTRTVSSSTSSPGQPSSSSGY